MDAAMEDALLIVVVLFGLLGLGLAAFRNGR